MSKIRQPHTVVIENTQGNTSNSGSGNSNNKPIMLYYNCEENPNQTEITQCFYDEELTNEVSHSDYKKLIKNAIFKKIVQDDGVNHIYYINPACVVEDEDCNYVAFRLSI